MIMMQWTTLSMNTLNARNLYKSNICCVSVEYGLEAMRLAAISDVSRSLYVIYVAYVRPIQLLLNIDKSLVSNIIGAPSAEI